MAEMIRSQRKIYSPSGYQGLTRQLREGEILVLEYFRKDGNPEKAKISSVSSYHAINRIDPRDIIAFWAIGKFRPVQSLSPESACHHRTTPVKIPNDHNHVTTVKRPVEDLVFRMLGMNTTLTLDDIFG